MRRLSFFSTSKDTKAHLFAEHGIEYDLTDEEVAPRKRKTPKSGALDIQIGAAYHLLGFEDENLGCSPRLVGRY